MEILRGQENKVVLELPSTWTVSADWYLDGVFKDTLTASYATDVWEITIPYILGDGNVLVRWQGSTDTSEPFEFNYEYDVVTPYLTLREVKLIYPEATDAEALELESAVRHIINAHCGQHFGREKKSLIVEGHGEKALKLPERLFELSELNTLTKKLDPRAAIITGEGWYLKKGWAPTLATIDNDSLYWGDDDPDHGTIIVRPTDTGQPTVWTDDYPFTIVGLWGWEQVPTAVKEAAKLLVNDYACSEIAYRDRYLQSIRAADWRLQFHSQAWKYTGNVRADQLLSEFVILDWAVI